MSEGIDYSLTQSMASEIPQNKLAGVYQVDPAQLSRWKTADGIDVSDPDDLVRHLALKGRPGALFDRLTAPGGIELAKQRIEELKEQIFNSAEE